MLRSTPPQLKKKTKCKSINEIYLYVQNIQHMIEKDHLLGLYHQCQYLWRYDQSVGYYQLGLNHPNSQLDHSPKARLPQSLLCDTSVAALYPCTLAHLYQSPQTQHSTQTQHLKPKNFNHTRPSQNKTHLPCSYNNGKE